MKVILLADVKKVGKRGAVVDVSDGYAQNVLLPKKLATTATPEALKKLQKSTAQKADAEALQASLRDHALRSIDGAVLTIPMRANEAGVLFRAVHSDDIAEAIHRILNVAIPPSAIILNEHIKKSGSYSIGIEQGKTRSKITVNIE